MRTINFRFLIFAAIPFGICSSAFTQQLQQDLKDATILTIDKNHFSLNGKPTFLTGISYYGGLGASDEIKRLPDRSAGGDER